MTELKSLNRDELLRLAALDVYGLLDEFEAAHFNRSFHEASAPVQDEVVALQAAIAADTSLLISEEPSKDLRDRVLARVQEAMEREAEHLAPFPIFARRKVRMESQRQAHRRIERAAKWWRAAAFVMAASIVILAVLLVDARRQSDQVYDIARGALESNLANEILPDYKAFVNNPNVVIVNLRPDGPHDAQVAQVAFNRASGAVLVLALGFEPSTADRYELVVRGPDRAEPRRLGAFKSNGTLACIDDFDALTQAELGAYETLTWEIIDTETRQTIALA